MKTSLMISRPSIAESLLAANCLCSGLGRLSDAVALLARFNGSRMKQVEAIGLANNSFRVLDSVWAAQIGHLALVDYVIKLGILEGRRLDETILYLPPGSRIANPFLLQQIATRLRLVDDPADLPFSASAVPALHYNLMGPRLPDQTTAYIWEVAGRTYGRWHRDGRAPLFELPEETSARGRAALRQMGVPQDAWFVALHVREKKWSEHNLGMDGIRNADLFSYFPAISEITRRGGWVIRIGDPTMTPLPPMPNVIDYCHSSLRADWMDIFILARCRFMIATNSGPFALPALYGVPTLLTNWWPHGARPWHASDIFVPKMPRRLSDNRYLTLSEALREPISWCLSRRHLAHRGGVCVDGSDPELIRGAVAEMLARLEGKPDHGADVAELRRAADTIYQSHGVVGMGQFASDFLRQYADLIA